MKNYFIGEYEDEAKEKPDYLLVEAETVDGAVDTYLKMKRYNYPLAFCHGAVLIIVPPDLYEPIQAYKVELSAMPTEMPESMRSLNDEQVH